MKLANICNVIGIAVLSFGVGVLISFFLPESVLVVIEALVIVAVGVLFFMKK
ncbi:MAG: hypothetical protein MJ078_05430 [Clostridia bacterium]|nr:hypothetical protein [Clostridia bacterium]